MESADYSQRPKPDTFISIFNCLEEIAKKRNLSKKLQKLFVPFEVAGNRRKHLLSHCLVSIS